MEDKNLVEFEQLTLPFINLEAGDIQSVMPDVEIKLEQVDKTKAEEEVFDERDIPEDLLLSLKTVQKNTNQSELERLYALSLTSKAAYDEYATFVLNMLEPLIQKMAGNLFYEASLSKGIMGNIGPISKEDLVQAGHLAILEALPKYNPSTKATTFFFIRIRSRMYREKRVLYNNSEYFCKVLPKLMNAANEAGYDDFVNCPVSKLAILSNSRTSTIVSAKASYGSTDSFNDIEESNLQSMNAPLDEGLLQAEESSQLKECLCKLTPYQTLLVTAYNGVTIAADGNLDVVKSASFQKIKDMAKGLGVEVSSISTIQRDYSEAISRLRYLLKNEQNPEGPKDLGMSSYMQASDDELITMFEIM